MASCVGYLPRPPVTQRCFPGRVSFALAVLGAMMMSSSYPSDFQPQNGEGSGLHETGPYTSSSSPASASSSVSASSVSPSLESCGSGCRHSVDEGLVALVACQQGGKVEEAGRHTYPKSLPHPHHQCHNQPIHQWYCIATAAAVWPALGWPP